MREQRERRSVVGDRYKSNNEKQRTCRVRLDLTLITSDITSDCTTSRVRSLVSELNLEIDSHLDLDLIKQRKRCPA